MLPRIDEIPLCQMIDVLSKTRMSIGDKNRVMKYKREFHSGGALSNSRVRELKVIFAKYRRRIVCDEKVRDLERESKGRDRLGITKREVAERQRRRLDSLRRSVEDFGI